MNDYKHRTQVLRLAQAEWARVSSKRAPYDFPKDSEAEEFVVRAMAYFQHRGFMADTEPMRRQLADIHSLALPKYIMVVDSSSGLVIRDGGDGLSKESREHVVELERWIRGVAEEWGIPLAVPVDALA
jgi:hypothetical protein